ncbi:ATG16 [Candida metapsilosis]|uniref:ATG16 n=1 Tax=Candida metapsilosis TaxID=273372 RepID=A0A8H7ZGT6_9ASCO|nr:ATG16 [Candida metapsilosis]
MSTKTWSEEILERLKIRDEVEKKDSEYYFAFQQLVDKLLVEQQQREHQQHLHQQGKEDNNAESNETPFSSKSPSPSTILGISNEKAKQTTNKSKPKAVTQDTSNDNATVVATIKENHQLRNENEELVSNLNSITLKNERLEAIIKDKDKQIGKLEKLTTKLQKNIESLSLEIKEKNKTIELINDENLTNQIQLNVLRAKIEKGRSP